MTDYTDLKARLRTVSKGVTPGPWVDDGGEVFTENGFTIADVMEPDCEANTAFIAATRDLVPEALAAIEALEAEVARLRGDSDDYYERWNDCQEKRTAAEADVARLRIEKENAQSAMSEIARQNEYLRSGFSPTLQARVQEEARVRAELLPSFDDPKDGSL